MAGAQISGTEALEKLKKDEAFIRLVQHVPELSVARAFGVHRKEVPHSRMIAALLDGKRRDLAVPVWNALAAVLHRLGADKIPQSSEVLEVESRSELDHIDLVVRAKYADGEILVGIENKIDADERERQLEDYQKALENRPADHRFLVFLTPTGRPPTTHAPKHHVRVLQLSYAELVEVLRAALLAISTPATGPVKRRNVRLLEEIIDHIREEIVGDTEVRKLVREVYARNAEAIRLLAAFKPGLEDIRARYEAAVRAHLQDDAVFDTYGAKHLTEISLTPKSWAARGIPLTVMLHAAYADQPVPAVQLVVNADRYRAHKHDLAAWAKRVNDNGGLLGKRVDEDFQPLEDWSAWRRVLDEGRGAGFFGDAGFGERVAEEAAPRALQIIDAVTATLV